MTETQRSSRTFSSFKPDYANAGVVDWQKIRLQEQAIDDAKDEARVPRTIECELTEVRLQIEHHCAYFSGFGGHVCARRCGEGHRSGEDD